MSNENVVTQVSVVTFAEVFTEEHEYQVYPDGRVKMWLYLTPRHTYGWDFVDLDDCPEEYDLVREVGLKALNIKHNA